MEIVTTATNKLFVNKALINKQGQQSGIVLILVLVFLLAMSLLSMSSISSSKLQLTLLNNQQTYLDAVTKLNNAKQLVFSQLSGDTYSEKIFNLDSVLDSNNKLTDSSGSINYCDEQLDGHWLFLDLNLISNSSHYPESIELAKVLVFNDLKTYLSVISIEFIDGENTNTNSDLNLSSARLETLMIKQCLALNNSSLWLLQTSIITRQTSDEFGTDKFNISPVFGNTEIKQSGN